MFDQNKYLVTEHKTTTEDGYILTFFRVNLKSKAEQNLYQNEPNSVIHLQHGIFDSSDMWFFNGEGKSVGFYLVDQGYDVWVGNNRGNKYSHDHVNDKISEYDFFNYSFDEMALYDVPAFYKYIQEQTNGKKLTWIGHSQGTSQFFAAALDVKTKVFIENNTNKFIALAPIVYMKNIGSTIFELVAKGKEVINFAASELQLYEVAPSSCQNNPKWAGLIQFACDHFTIFCESFPGINMDKRVDTALDDIGKFVTHIPSGSSLKSLIKLAQMIDYSGKPTFKKYDYGYLKNFYIYGTYYAPEWNVEEFNVPTALIGGEKDEFANIHDVTILSTRLNVNKTSLHWMKDYDH